MRVDLTLPDLTVLPQLGRALQSLGLGHPVPIKKWGEPPVSAQRDKPGEPYSEKVHHGRDTITKEII